MPTIYTLIAFYSWPVLFLVWLFGYIGLKKTIKKPEMGRYLFTSLLIFFGFEFLFGVNGTGWFAMALTPRNDLFGIIGDVICLGGIAFAIWARMTLGSNWSGGVATLKENHQLMQSGPYHYVRHPIYTGFFFAMLGTALTLGTSSAYLGVLFGLIAFLMRIPMEERLMISQFQDVYRKYKQSTKALIPFVW